MNRFRMNLIMYLLALICVPAGSWAQLGPRQQPPAQPAERDSVVVHELRWAHPHEVAEIILNLVADREGMAISADVRRNLLLVRASPEEHQRIIEIIKAVDKQSPAGRAERPADPEAKPTFQVRVYWLTDAAEAGDAQPTELPDALSEAVNNLDSWRESTPRQIAQLLITVADGSTFKLAGSPEADINMNVIGSAERSDQPDWVWVKIQIECTDRRQGSGPLASLDTGIHIPLEHFVLIGVAPVSAEDLSSNTAFAIYVERL